MLSIILLAATTVLYAGYNLLVKQSADVAGSVASTTITATIALQIAALSTSIIFAIFLKVQGGHSMTLSMPTYLWAIGAGICIGIAEILYFYLFSGISGLPAMSASVVIPTVVAGTVVLALVASTVLFGERLNLYQLFGGLMITGGIVLLYIRD